MTEHPIAATKAEKIRDDFLSKADELQAGIDSGEYPASLQRQVDSWRRMAAKRYESMRIVGSL